MATLLQDLSDRKLLDGTIVCGAANSANPKIQWENLGTVAGHWPMFFGGVGRRRIQGRPCRRIVRCKGEQVKERPSIHAM